MKVTKEDIYNQLCNSMAKLFEIEKDDIKLESQLNEELDLDSIDAIDLLVHLQKTTGLKFQPEEFKLVKTVSDVVEVVYTRLNKEV
jgi:acyl carrier protein